MGSEPLPVSLDPRSPAPVRWPRLAGALGGLLSLGVFLGVAELLSPIFGAVSAPAVAIGESAIDRTPHQLKDYAIRQFGESDKTVLLTGIFVTLAILAALAGLAATFRLGIGIGAVALLTVVVGSCRPVTTDRWCRRHGAVPRRRRRCRCSAVPLRTRRSRPDRRMTLARSAGVSCSATARRIAAAAAAVAGVAGRTILQHTAAPRHRGSASRSRCRTARRPPIVGQPAGRRPGRQAVLHAQQRLLPGRHRAERAAGRRRRPGR